MTPRVMSQTTKFVTEFYRFAQKHTMEENDSVYYHPPSLTVYEIYEGVVVFYLAGYFDAYCL